MIDFYCTSKRYLFLLLWTQRLAIVLLSLFPLPLDYSLVMWNTYYRCGEHRCLITDVYQCWATHRCIAKHHYLRMHPSLYLVRYEKYPSKIYSKLQFSPLMASSVPSESVFSAAAYAQPAFYFYRALKGLFKNNNSV